MEPALPNMDQRGTGIPCWTLWPSTICPGCSECTASGRTSCSLFSCMACVVHVSLRYSSLLIIQALYIAIFVLTENLEFSHTRVVRRTNVVAAFPILLPISLSREKLLLIVDPMYVIYGFELPAMG